MEKEFTEASYIFPDTGITVSEMYEYGYTWDKMLPLTQEKALELFERNLPVYMLYNDGSETMAEEKVQITSHDGIYGIEKEDWELKRNIEASRKAHKNNIKMEENKMAKTDEKENKEWITISYMEENSHVFTGKDLKQYVSIDAGEGYGFIRPAEQIMRVANDEKMGAFHLPIDFECTLKRSIKDEKGQYVTEEIKADAKSLSERIRKNNELSQFVNISVSQKRVVSTFNVSTENGPVEYSKILAPGGISYIRPSEKLKKDNYNEGHVYFTMHKDNIIKCQRNTDEVLGVTDTGKNIYKVENFEMRPEELKELYAKEKRINAPSAFYDYQKPQAETEKSRNNQDELPPVSGKSR